MPLDIKAEIGKIRETYNSDPLQKTFNVLVTSESGCGKTFMARTCPFPVHIDSFDPGGTKNLRKWIDSGDIVVDARYESEDPNNPKAFALWKSEFEKRVRNGYFDHFATYMLDSVTTWSDAIMYWVMQKDGLAGQAPRYTKDYTPQKIEIRNYLKAILNLPCNSIVTGHLRAIEDQVTKAVTYRFLTTGQGMQTIPLLFDELYVLVTKKTGQEIKYQLLTQPTGVYLCRSRLAGDGKLSAIEEPNIKALMQKAGVPLNDKPKLA